METGYLQLLKTRDRINCLKSSSDKKEIVLLIWNQMEVKL